MLAQAEAWLTPGGGSSRFWRANRSLEV